MVYNQLPEKFQGEGIDQTNDPGGDEKQVQSVYGNRFHLLTPTLVKQISNTFPATYFTLIGQGFWDSPKSKDERFKKIELNTFLSYNPKTKELQVYNDNAGQYELYE